MKTSNLNTPSMKNKLAVLALALASLLPLAAQAHDGVVRHDIPVRVSGKVSVSHQVPGGVITVGIQLGHQPQPRPAVVIVKERRPDVIVIEKNPGRDAENNRRWEYAHRHNRELKVIREEPRSHNWSDGRQVSIDRQGPGGTYHYYEDGNQVSIDDNRGGQTKHVYIRK